MRENELDSEEMTSEAGADISSTETAGTELPFVYNLDEMETVESYISECFGEVSMVMHEIVSPDVHIDICMIPPCPQEGRDFYTFVTMGMGAYRMNVPKELAEYKLERAELMLRLPADWHVEDKAFQDEQWYWPFRLLKMVARLPLEEDGWIGWGHTIGMEEGETYAENTKLCGCMVVSVQMSEDGSLYCELPNGDEVNFYQLLPLYKEEMDFKLAHGADALLERFPENFSSVVDIARLNVISGQ